MSSADEKPSTRTIPLRDAIASSVANANVDAPLQPICLPDCLPPSPMQTPEEDFLGSPSLESLLDEADFWTPVVLPTQQEPCSDGMMSDYLEMSEFDADPAMSETAESAPVLTDADVVQNQRHKLNEVFLKSCNDLAHLAVDFDDVSGAINHTIFGGFVDDDMFTGIEEFVAGNQEVGCDVNATASQGLDLNGELHLHLWAMFPELTGRHDQVTADNQGLAVLLEPYQRAIQEAICFEVPLRTNSLSAPSSPSTLSGHPTPELDYSDFTDEENITTPINITNVYDKFTDFNAINALPTQDSVQTGRKRSFSEQQQEENDRKRHKCDECEESFGIVDHLVIHRKTHIKETGVNKCNYVNPITNESCNKVFARSYDLFRHQVKHYPETKRTFDCDICRKSFSRLDALQRHNRTQGHTKQAMVKSRR